MTQRERLLWLIKHQLAERYDGDSIGIPQDNEELFCLYRSLVNVRPPSPVCEEYLEIQDAYLQTISRERGIVRLSDMEDTEENLYIWQGDITRLDVDAIVNAANSGLLGCFHPCHNCIDNCIHTYAGIQLREECNRLILAQGHEEPTGQAKITGGYNLPAKHVIHTVGPIVSGQLQKAQETELASCYKYCMELASKSVLECIAFCCISTGVFGFPQERAAEIAVDTVKKFKSPKMKVIFNVYKDTDKKLYRKLFAAKN